jgi:hypothetical protein
MPDQKTRLTMTRYNIAAGGSVTIDRSKTFSVMINPAEFKQEYSIEYSPQKTLGQIGSDNKFSAVNSDKVGFSLVLDGTGAVPASTAGTAPADVKTQINNLLAVVYQYDGETHEPGRVRLLWGSLIFFGRMTTMSTQYTLFKPSGAPLRAKVDLQFVGSMSKSEEQLVSNRSSPDLSHIVLVREGDTLPLLCASIYGDPSYYPEVARFNGLLEFRDLKPGAKLHFPPLE